MAVVPAPIVVADTPPVIIEMSMLHTLLAVKRFWAKAAIAERVALPDVFRTVLHRPELVADAVPMGV
jgi:hypothetical protein